MSEHGASLNIIGSYTWFREPFLRRRDAGQGSAKAVATSEWAS